MNETQPAAAVPSTAGAGPGGRRPTPFLGWTGLTSRAVPDTWRPGVEDLRRPPRPRLHRELAGAVAGLRLPGALPRLARAPRGDGHVVVDVPGWRAPEVVGLPLRRYRGCSATTPGAGAWA